MATFKGKSSSSKPKVGAFAKATAKAEPREASGDEFDVGSHVVRYVSCNEADGGAFCFKFEGDKCGERIVWFSTAGKSIRVSAPRVKALCMLLSGFGDNDEYDQFDPHGEFIEAIVHGETEAAAELLVSGGAAKNAKEAAALLATEITIKVSKGGDKDDGGFFRNASFSAATDAEDTDDEDEAPESEEVPKRTAKKASKRAPAPVVDEDDADEEDEDDPESEPESEPAPRAKKKAARR